ncbi:MAG: 2-oxoacid:acceptor oxidoreductase family protein [Sedimentisphaerales bacterium]|nr:2-oxoacid:acceptor oxidoreductase family protein [Sedimentisphaerales bacterium]
MKTNGSYQQVVIAGFGGQGIILAGKLLAQAAMKSGREVTYMPSYGAEVRGGTANCMLVIAQEAISSPVIDSPDTVIAMNKASVAKFAPKLKTGGLLIFNSSLVDQAPKTNVSIEVIALPADKIAHELGSTKVANMVALGAYLQKSGIFGPESAANCLADVLAERYHVTIPLNKKALQQGAEFVKKTSG